MKRSKVTKCMYVIGSLLIARSFSVDRLEKHIVSKVKEAVDSLCPKANPSPYAKRS